VAAPSDEVHSTQELLEVRQGSQGLGRLGELRESRGGSVTPGLSSNIYRGKREIA